jgi:hypothetical protein
VYLFENKRCADGKIEAILQASALPWLEEGTPVLLFYRRRHGPDPNSTPHIQGLAYSQSPELGARAV